VTRISRDDFELLVSRIVQGARVSGKESTFDVLAGDGKTRIEVKGSNSSGHGRGQFLFGRFLGSKGGEQNSEYDRLILVGHNQQTGDLRFFDIPYDWVLTYCKPNKFRTITFCVNGNGHLGSVGYEIKDRYECTEEQLTKRYGVRDNFNTEPYQCRSEQLAQEQREFDLLVKKLQSSTCDYSNVEAPENVLGLDLAGFPHLPETLIAKPSLNALNNPRGRRSMTREEFAKRR
jgi:hypothetical protein